MNKSLMKEIARQILADVGAVPSNLFGTVGLAENTCLSKREVKLEYDEGITRHTTYSGEIEMNGEKLRAFLIDLTDEAPEFILTYRFGTNPIISISSSYGYEEDNSFIKEFNIEDKSWKIVGIKEQANMLIGFEKIVSCGLLWSPSDNINDLYDAAITLVS